MAIWNQAKILSYLKQQKNKSSLPAERISSDTMQIHRDSLDLGQIEDMLIILPKFGRFLANDFFSLS